MLAKLIKRERRQKKVRAKIAGTSVKPRLAIFRSNANIYAQLIDDVAGVTICASSDLKMKGSGTKSERAKKVWSEIAELAKKKDIQTIVFDRGWFSYHGRVKALAEWAREAGLTF
jgi:large subunit ribosomal protein L18